MKLIKQVKLVNLLILPNLMNLVKLVNLAFYGAIGAWVSSCVSFDTSVASRLASLFQN